MRSCPNLACDLYDILEIYMILFVLGILVGAAATLLAWYTLTRRACEMEGEKPPTFLEFVDTLLNYIEG